MADKYANLAALTEFLSKVKAWANAQFATKAVATQSADGLLSSSDKTKLDGIATGATANTGTVTSIKIQGTSPIVSSSSSAITTSGTRTISHATSGATAGSYGDSAAQTPAYGGTFKVPYVTVNDTGHVTNITEHTVKIPASDNTDHRKSFYATCDTAADAQKKVATLANSDGWELKAGTIVGVKFTNTNTYESTAEAPVTLNVNNTGDKPIYYNNAASPTGTNTSIYGYANRIIYYMYDGTNWCWFGDGRHDGNSDTKVRQTLKTDNVDRPLLMAYSNTSTTTGNVDNIAYRNNSIYANASTGNIQATKLNGVTIGSSPKFTDTTYESKAAASGGSDVSLVTTGEKYTWNNKTSNTGTVTKISTGAGLTGGDITATGTVKADLTSETKLTNAAADGTETSGRVYPVRLDKNGKMAVNVPWTDNNTTYSAGTGLSLSGTTFNHSNSVTAQTTQAVYPIKIDGQGHISGYGSAVSIGNLASLSTNGSTSQYLRGDGNWATPSVSVPKFINTGNVIASQSDGTSIDWTATQDCVFMGRSGNKRFYIDGVAVIDAGDGSALLDFSFYLKQGQRITCANYNGWGGWRYKAFAIKS